MTAHKRTAHSKSIYIKNAANVILLLFLSFAALALVTSIISYHLLLKDRTSEMSSNAEYASRMVSACIEEWGGDAELEVHTMVNWISKVTGSDILITNQRGVVIVCSDSPYGCEHIDKTIPAEVLSSINRDGEYSDVGTLGGIFDNGRYIVGVPLSNSRYETYGQGYILLSNTWRGMLNIWNKFFIVCISSSVVIALAALMMALITTKRNTKPIHEMAEAAERFGKGDFSSRVNTGGRDDEIGELAEAFNSMADSLERSEKSRREFIANVSHEFKTPMTTITGFADGILDGTIPPEKEREYLALISSESKRLSRLVRGMLDMSQLQSGSGDKKRFKSFNLNEVVCQALLSLEKKITDRGLDVDARLPEEPVMTIGDRDAIMQVVYNLIDNAAKFAKPNTAIGISLWKADGKARVSIENQGETISKEELPLIFDRFHKSDRSRSIDRNGVGLGLYIVKTILDNHEEDIFVTSHDGVTTFTFTLTLSGKFTENSRNS